MAKNVIFGLSGATISDQEREFFKRNQPLGFILFARNIRTPEQVKELTADLKSVTHEGKVPIFIDQEGGRVRRLKPPYFREAKAAGEFAGLAAKNLSDAQLATFLNHYLMARELADLGVNVNCAPVLDLLHDGAHSIIGDRSFGADPMLVVELAKYAIYGMMAAGVLPVIKHIPGHGRAVADSHYNLPVIDAPLAELEQTDFVPFKELSWAPLAMTAHLVIKDIDPQKPVTTSAPVINYIREHIGFKNILITDAIEMKALEGTLASRVSASVAAGCDLVLHCTGKLDEMREVIEHAHDVNENTMANLQHLDVCFVSAKIEAGLSQYLGLNSCDIEKILNNLF